MLLCAESDDSALGTGAVERLDRVAVAAADYGGIAGGEFAPRRERRRQRPLHLRKRETLSSSGHASSQGCSRGPRCPTHPHRSRPQLRYSTVIGARRALGPDCNLIHVDTSSAPFPRPLIADAVRQEVVTEHEPGPEADVSAAGSAQTLTAAPITSTAMYEKSHLEASSHQTREPIRYPFCVKDHGAPSLRRRQLPAAILLLCLGNLDNSRVFPSGPTLSARWLIA